MASNHDRFGGTNGFQWFNDVWCYDSITNVWTELDCIGYIPAPREGHAAALVDDVMYIFGGRTEEGADLGDLAAFRITSRRWYTFQNMGPSPSPRSGHSMTSYSKQIIVLAGEPSSAAREAQDLATVYVLDTTKIRYPNDQQIQQTPAGERAPGRRPSGGEKSGMGAGRGPTSRDGSIGPEPRRLNSIPPRDSVMGPPNMFTRPNGQPGVNGNDMNGVAPGSAQPQGPGSGQGSGPVSKLPRASIMQAPSGPPPQQQAPTRPNGAPSVGNPPRVKLPGRPERGFGPTIDTGVRSQSPATQGRTMSPAGRDSPSTKEGPLANGRRTPTQQPVKPPSKQETSEAPAVEQATRESPTPAPAPIRTGSKTRQGRQQGSVDSTNESGLRNVTNRPSSPPPPSRQGSNGIGRKGSGRNSQTVAILKELDAAKSRNAWYASELELAKKAGYQSNPSPSPILDQRAAESFGEADRPLIEALIAMRNELANVQGSIDQQAVLAARKIAEVEKQRDTAINEAIYAKAKFAAHGGSQNSTPQLDNESRDLGVMAADRSTDIARKLAAALATQKELQQHVDMLNAELEAERRGRELAEETANAAQNRISELESYKQQNSSEVERLKAELHEVHKEAREHATASAEARSAAQLLQVNKDELESRHKELLESAQGHNETLDSLREAMAATSDMKSLLERKLEEERTQRERVEERLRKLRAEHEDRTAELDSASRRLRDAEEMAEKYANEARTHCQAVAAGLDKVSSRDISSTNSGATEIIAALQAQVEAANALVRKYQAAADAASEKLRSAEERIAGLEAYQEQVSREGLSIRKQLQAALRETQSLQAANSEMKFQLQNQQLETNAVHVQHNTLKDLLGERGISPVGAARARGLSSPQNRDDTPDQNRVRELEQQLLSVQQAHDETKQNFETREQEAESSYREKLAQLEHDYQSAVHYVKGTEKMLKRMKDELSKYKTENTRMRSELEEAEGKLQASRSVPSEWEEERGSLRQQIENLQADLNNSHNQLERQLQEVRRELQTSQQERDHFKMSHEDAQRQLSESMQQARSDLTQLQHENSLLERRAMDAEQKVSLLLDQVETSVDNYRRQSRQVGDMNGGGSIHTHTRNLSGHDSISGDSIYSGPAGAGGLDNRNSVALDSLASELETLRTHWETTNKNYRLSNNFEFDRPARIEEENERSDAEPPLELSNSLADWRKRLDAEEHEARSRKGSNSAQSSGSQGSEGRRAMTPQQGTMI